MTKVIIIPEETLDSFYDRTVNYFENKYHNHSSTLKIERISTKYGEHWINSSNLAKNNTKEGDK